MKKIFSVNVSSKIIAGLNLFVSEGRYRLGTEEDQREGKITMERQEDQVTTLVDKGLSHLLPCSLHPLPFHPSPPFVCHCSFLLHPLVIFLFRCSRTLLCLFVIVIIHFILSYLHTTPASPLNNVKIQKRLALAVVSDVERHKAKTPPNQNNVTCP